jgi:plastocyanin
VSPRLVAAALGLMRGSILLGSILLGSILLGSVLLGSVPLHAETIEVRIEKFAFVPAQINAKVGDTIQWVNKDVVQHTATVEGGWDVLIPAAGSAMMIVKTAEEVEFFCRFHPNMRGRLVAKPR